MRVRHVHALYSNLAILVCGSEIDPGRSKRSPVAWWIVALHSPVRYAPAGGPAALGTWTRRLAISIMRSTDPLEEAGSDSRARHRCQGSQEGAPGCVGSSRCGIDSASAAVQAALPYVAQRHQVSTSRLGHQPSCRERSRRLDGTCGEPFPPVLRRADHSMVAGGVVTSVREEPLVGRVIFHNPPP